MIVAFLVGAAFLGLAWPTYLLLEVPGLPRLSLARLAMALGVLLFLAGPVFMPSVYRDVRLALRSAPTLFLLVLVWFLWRIFADLVGEDPAFSLPITILETVLISGMLLVGVLLSSRGNTRELMLSALLIATFVFVGVGAFEFLSGFDVGGFLARMSDMKDELARGMVESQMRAGRVRIRSLAAHPILLGQFLGAVFPFLVASFANRRSLLWRIPTLVAIIAIPVLIWATDARSGIIVLAVSCLTYVGLKVLASRANIAVKVLLVSLFVALLAFSFSAVMDDLFALLQGRNATEVSSSAVRDDMISKGLLAVTESPVTGFGHGRSGWKAGVTNAIGVLTIDNFYLSTLLDFGYVGLLIQLSLFLAIIGAGMRAAAGAEDPTARTVAVAGLAAVVAILIGQYVISSWDNQSLVFFFAAVFCGILMEQRRRREGLPSTVSREGYSYRPDARVSRI